MRPKHLEKQMKNRRRNGNGDPRFNNKRKLRDWTNSDQDREFANDLSTRIIYTGNPAHKRNPGNFNLNPPSAPRLNATLCDDAKIFAKAQAFSLLRKGALLGLVDERLQDGFPSLIWAIGNDGTVFEAQLENAGLCQYHGYPMPLADPFRQIVLQRARAG